MADHNSKHFVPGDFDGDGFTDIMTVLNASFFANLLDGNGQIKDLRHLAQGGFSADIIVTGHFGGHPIFCQACYTSFVVYNQN